MTLGIDLLTYTGLLVVRSLADEQATSGVYAVFTLRFPVGTQRIKKALGAGQETPAGWVLQWKAEWVNYCCPAPTT